MLALNIFSLKLSLYNQNIITQLLQCPFLPSASLMCLLTLKLIASFKIIFVCHSLCLYVLNVSRTDHMGLDLWGRSSLKAIDAPSFNGIDHLKLFTSGCVWPSETPLVPTGVAIMVVFSFGQSYYWENTLGCIFPLISRGFNLVIDARGFWLLESFNSLFHKFPWALGLAIVLQKYQLR